MSQIFRQIFRQSFRQSFRALAAGVIGCATLWPQVLSAQTQAPPPRGPNTLSGIVTDTTGQPLANVDVFVQELQRHARSRVDGTFYFDKVKKGLYKIGVRAVGYVGGVTAVTVSDSGGSAAIRMIAFGRSLATMVTTASRGGLSGVIGDTSYVAIPGAKVRVMGSSATPVETDSTGEFFIPVKPGHYLVELTRAGFRRQMVSVTVPDNEGRRVNAWLTPQLGGSNPREAANAFEMSQRIMRASPVWSKFMTHEDLEKAGVTEIRQVANMAAGGLVPLDCEVLVDGGPQRVPLWQLQADEVEYVEAYTVRPSRASRPTVRSINQNTSGLTSSNGMAPRPGDGCVSVTLIVWLRR